MAFRPNRGPSIFIIFVNKDYWNTAMPVHLDVIEGCFHTTEAEFISGNGLALSRINLGTPGLNGDRILLQLY